MIVFKLLVVIFSFFGISYGNTKSFACGRKATPTSFIRGGKETSVDEWPWAASLVYESNEEYLCSGSLIKPKTVLTAAHCIQNKHSDEVLKPEEVIVQLGISDLRASERKKKFQPKEIIVHEDWKPFDDRYDADIAILISEHDMQSLFISPVCLPEPSDFSSTDNVVGTVIGWGVSSDSANTNENVLRKVQVVKVLQEKCLLVDWRLGEISSHRTFCVAGINEGDGPCVGDSGGGFFVQTDGVWFIHGLVSSSITEANCPSSKHSIMTKIDSFVQWINNRESIKEVHFSYEMLEPWNGMPQFHLKVSKDLAAGDSLYTNNQTAISNRKVVVNLNDQDLSFLPNRIGELFPNVRKIDATRDCKIKQIKRSNFKNMYKLENLDLFNNLIRDISSDTFNDLKKLKSINLAYNKLKKIQPRTFANNPSLEWVDLSHNQIQTIVPRNFEDSNINHLLINNNLIETIPFDAFDGADSLLSIYTQDNEIKSLHKDIFSKNPQLNEIHAYDNEIEELPEGLFRNNKRLSFLELQNNQIIKIKTEFSVTGRYNFKGNVCIDKYFGDNIRVGNMNAELRRSC